MPHKELPELVKSHASRVGLLARLTARETGKDEHAAYLAGVFHDDGKAELPPDLFADKDITPEEYEIIKEHARLGYLEHKERMPKTALCSGLHHRMGAGPGYGITFEDIPKGISFVELKKLLDISTIVSLADFIDAFRTRHTKINFGLTETCPLRGLLLQSYPAEKLLIDVMMNIADTMYPKEESHA